MTEVLLSVVSTAFVLVGGILIGMGIESWIEAKKNDKLKIKISTYCLTLGREFPILADTKLYLLGSSTEHIHQHRLRMMKKHLEIER